jgi:hypothetical protein
MAKHPAPKGRQPVIVKEREGADAPDTAPGRNGSPKVVSGVKNKQAEAIKATEVLQSVAGLNLDVVSGKIAATQVEVQKSLAGLSAKLVEELETLRNVEEAITLKREELKQLYDIEAGAVDLDELYAKIDGQREAWEEEQARKQREFAETQSERNKQWARAEEEYQYRLAQEHKKQEDAFRGKSEDLEKANRNRQEALEKGWAEREAELKKRETELQELRARVDAIPEVVKKAENAAQAVATNSVKKELLLWQNRGILSERGNHGGRARDPPHAADRVQPRPVQRPEPAEGRLEGPAGRRRQGVVRAEQRPPG